MSAFFQLFRLPALFTAWSNILAAQLIVTFGQIEWKTLLLLILTSSSLYLSGLVLNDCFDLEEDRRERPQRPLPSGQISIRLAWLIGYALLIGGCALAWLVGLEQLLIAVVLATAILAYDGWLKSYIIGSLVMGSCRYLNWLLGLSVAPLDVVIWMLPIPILLYISALTILSRVETGTNDRAPLTLCISGVLLAALSLLPMYTAGILREVWVLAPGIILLILLMRLFAGLYRDLQPDSIQRVIKIMLLGIIPLDAFLVFAAGPWWGGLLVLALLIPGQLLSRLIYIT